MSNTLYKKIKKKVKYLYYINKILLITSVIVITYIGSDIYSKSKKTISFQEVQKIQNADRIIEQPRMQLEVMGQHFHYITANRAIWNPNKDIIDLYNIKVDSTLGTMRSDILTIKNNNTLLEFRGNPIFNLYLENNKKEI